MYTVGNKPSRRVYTVGSQVLKMSTCTKDMFMSGCTVYNVYMYSKFQQTFLKCTGFVFNACLFIHVKPIAKLKINFIHKFMVIIHSQKFLLIWPGIDYLIGLIFCMTKTLANQVIVVHVYWAHNETSKVPVHIHSGIDQSIIKFSVLL